MKKLLATLSLALVAVVTCVGLVGCKKNNADEKYLPKAFAGNYRCTKINLKENGETADEQFLDIFLHSYINLGQDGSIKTNLFDNLFQFANENAEHMGVDPNNPIAKAQYNSSWVFNKNRIIFSIEVEFLNALNEPLINDELLFYISWVNLATWTVDKNLLRAHLDFNGIELSLSYIK